MKTDSQLQKKELSSVQRLLNEDNPDIKECLHCFIGLTKEDPLTLPALKKLLQSSITLEFATIPPYLCAIWSIKEDTHPVAQSIREILQEEMLHMALACNMLVAIGGDPKIHQPGFVPEYPMNQLPGGIHPGLKVSLSGLNNEALRGFMKIELPESVIAIEGSESIGSEGDTKTIGELYDQINDLFQLLKPPMSADRQVTGPLEINDLSKLQDPSVTTDSQVRRPLEWVIIDDLEKVDNAVTLIKHQGEGSCSTCPIDTGLDDMAHFYRFWEILQRKRIEEDAKTGKFAFKTDFSFPEVWPMAKVPKGGYQKEAVSAEVWRLLSKFDETYTHVVGLLQNTWEAGGQASLWKAIEMMFKLEQYAIPLMKIPIPGGGGNYGPCFRLIDLEPGTLNRRVN